MSEKRQTEPYMAKYLHEKGRKLGLPISGNFELTARCNFDCPMCYVHKKSQDTEAIHKELTAQQWIDIAEKARDKGMVFALLTGGEPFVRKDFFEIYEAMKAMGLIVSINSNGSMLEGKIREKLLENQPSRINISLYGGTNETYQNMCGQPAFDKVVNNIRALREGGVDVRLSLSITPYNRQDLKEIYEISKELGVHVKAASYMYPPIRINGEQFGCAKRLSAQESGRCSVEWEKMRLEPDEFMKRCVSTKTMIEELSAKEMLDYGNKVACRAGSSSFWMTWEGKMLPCGMFSYPCAYPLEDGFEQAWDKILKETREIRLPEKCSNCAKRKVCGVCAAVCLTETGHFDGVPEYMCEKTDEMIRETIKQAFC